MLHANKNLHSVINHGKKNLPGTKIWMMGSASRLLLSLLLPVFVLPLSACKSKIDQDANASASQTQASKKMAKVRTIYLSDKDFIFPQAQSIAKTLPITGAFKAQKSTIIKAKVSGELRDFTWDIGQQVQVGQKIGSIDNGDQTSRHQQAIAQALVQQQQLQLAEKQLERQAKLAESGFISPNALDTFQTNVSVAKANVEAAAQNVNITKKGLNDVNIHSSIAGYVSQKFVENNEKVLPDQRLLEVVDLSAMELEVKVSAHDIAKVQAGQATKVGYAGGELYGTVSRIAPTASENSRLISVFINFPNPDGAIKAGAFTQGELLLARVDALLLPSNVIYHENKNGKDAPWVYVVKDHKTTVHPIKVTSEQGAYSLVEDIDPTQAVIALPLNLSDRGLKVEMKPRAAASTIPATSATVAASVATPSTSLPTSASATPASAPK